ncbi:UDP-sugar pyrophosphorylase [Strigomonas culicis]|nr:UDP-sugar pyrophosphorylase [Strigomonas culicis]|eukprot:EPY20784.1 UDP-sugar pyrophosphorylase [Strigomonas culicis]
MTSDDTHTRTVEALARLRGERAAPDAPGVELPDIFLVKQEMVFCFKDSAAHLALQYVDVPPSGGVAGAVPSNKPTGKDPYLVLPKKPHGHGDVHTLLHDATISESHLSAFLPQAGLCAPPTHGHDRLLDYLLYVQKKKHIVFFQDTNATSVLTIPISLALSEREDLVMNCTCIPRKPREAIGLLCSVLTAAAEDDAEEKREGEEGSTAAAPRAAKSKVGRWRTALVEYNIFEDIAKSMFSEEADEKDGRAGRGESGPGEDEPAAADTEESRAADDARAHLLPFPGSINTLILQFPAYYRVVQKTKGKVPEFINPKYENDAKRAFRTPARLESLMQDIALLFENHYDLAEDTASAVSAAPPQCRIVGERIGGTVFARWTYAPVKNHFDEVEKKVRAHMEPYGATSAEEKYYDLIRARLCAVGLRLPTLPHGGDGAASLGTAAWLKTQPDVYISEAVRACLLPNVVLDPAALPLASLRRMFPHPQQVCITERSTLIVEGHVVIESLHLDGALRVVGPAKGSGPPLVLTGVTVQNEGWCVRPVRSLDSEEVILMRGFVFEKRATHVIDTNTDLSKL